jgi:hypothetical protein
MAFSLGLGIWGLFSSWPRRHAILAAILSLMMIAFLIVNIILAASREGTCIPHYKTVTDDDDDFQLFDNGINDNIGNNNNNVNRFLVDRWCGSRLTVYITHGILLGLFVSIYIYKQMPLASIKTHQFFQIPYFLLNFIASREEREWEKGAHTPRKTDTAVPRTTTTAAH